VYCQLCYGSVSSFIHSFHSTYCLKKVWHKLNGFSCPFSDSVLLIYHFLKYPKYVKPESMLSVHSGGILWKSTWCVRALRKWELWVGMKFSALCKVFGRVRSHLLLEKKALSSLCFCWNVYLQIDFKCVPWHVKDLEGLLKCISLFYYCFNLKS